jgi:hypothetical protein
MSQSNNLLDLPEPPGTKASSFLFLVVFLSTYTVVSDRNSAESGDQELLPYGRTLPFSFFLVVFNLEQQ